MPENAYLAPGTAGNAYRPAMIDNQMGEDDPILPGNNLHQIPFDFVYIAVPGKTEKARQPFDMSIDDNSFGLAVPCPQYHRTAFAADSRQSYDFRQ